MGVNIMETNRMRIREMGVQDFDSLYRIFQDRDVMQYYPDIKNEEETRQWILWTISNYRKYGIGLWILEDKATHAFIGQCGFVPQKIEEEVKIELGYMIAKEWWKQGLATEAAEACMSYGFNQLRFNQIVSLIDPENKPSIRVSEKLAMTFQKNVRKWNKELGLYVIQP